MSQKTLVTQGELKNTVNSLSALADNLNDHVNTSMSKSHGWTGQQGFYMDSGGNYHSGPVGPVTGHRVVRIVVGQAILYAPAQLSGGIDGTPDVTLPPYTGIVSPQSADPASDLSVGSPTEAALVTQFADALNVVANSAGALLVAHAGSPPELVHGGLSVQIDYVRDAPSGHLMARRSVVFRYKGEAWRILCDQSPSGPTQPPRLVNSCQQIIIHANAPGHGSDSLDNIGPCSWLEKMDAHNGNQVYVAECQVIGTPPISYQWEYATNPTSGPWHTMVELQTYTVNAGFTFSPLPSNYYFPGDQWVTTPLIGTANSPPPSINIIRIQIQNNGSKQNQAYPAYGIRLKIDNTAAGDGASIYSNTLLMNLEDNRDDCFP